MIVKLPCRVEAMWRRTGDVPRENFADAGFGKNLTDAMVVHMIEHSVL